jgi:hypothetical protein
MAFATLAFAQAASPPPAPKAPVATGNTGGTACDMIGIVDGSATINGVEYDTGYIYSFAPAIPMADVNDNHAKWMKVLNVASQQQDKGGPYDAELSEYRSCDGGGIVKISDGSVLIKGMTLAGMTKVTDEGLKQAASINDRTKGRAKSPKSVDHDHSRAKKVKRDDLGRKQRDDDDKPGKKS